MMRSATYSRSPFRTPSARKASMRSSIGGSSAIRSLSASPPRVETPAATLRHHAAAAGAVAGEQRARAALRRPALGQLVGAARAGRQHDPPRGHLQRLVAPALGLFDRARSTGSAGNSGGSGHEPLEVAGDLACCAGRARRRSPARARSRSGPSARSSGSGLPSTIRSGFALPRKPRRRTSCGCMPVGSSTVR